MATGEARGSYWTYDLLLWILSIIVDLFFREVHPRSTWKIPKTGPIIIVAAPHANQFVDPLILMRTLRREAGRRVSWLMAEKSLKRAAIGTMARMCNAVSVGRALDSQTSMPGTIYLPDPENEPTLLKGVGTDFKDEHFQVGGLIVLPSVHNESANAEIAEIVNSEEIRLKGAFKGPTAFLQLTGKQEKGFVDQDAAEQANKHRTKDGTKFKVAPKVDQSSVYEQVFERLNSGGCIGIFPEGGSHDRTELLPLKAGVAIMALGAMAEHPDSNLKIIPCGMNYFHAHKFRSRAVVEFGTPIEVPKELVEEYKNGSRRQAIGRMLDIVYNGLVAVTVTAPDYNTLMMIQAVRRLYKPKGKKLPLPLIVELNRRLVKGYNKYKDDPRILKLSKDVISYNKDLFALGVRDHQLDYAKFSVIEVLAKLVYRLAKIAILTIAILPGLWLFAPVFAISKYMSIKKSKEALAASSVKIQGRDVVATWKLLVSMALAPALYTYYTIILAGWTYYNRVQGLVPEEVPIWGMVVFGFFFFPALSYAALRFGETGMDIVKSLRPLFLCLIPSTGNTFVKLRKKRQKLVEEVTNTINELGPEVFPDFDHQRLVDRSDGKKSPSAESPRGRETMLPDFFKSRDTSPSDPSRFREVSIGGGSSMSGHLPPNESFKNLGRFGFFASRPQTPGSELSRSQSHSDTRSSRPSSSNGGYFGMTGLSPMKTLDDKGAMDDVKRKIRGAMKERGMMRKESYGAANGDAHRDDEAIEDSDGESSSNEASEDGGESLNMISSATTTATDVGSVSSRR